MWQHEHNCGTRQVLSLTLELCLLSVVMWGGQRPGIITLSPVPTTQTNYTEGTQELLPCLYSPEPSSSVSSHFYYPGPLSAICILFLCKTLSIWKKKRKIPPSRSTPCHWNHLTPVVMQCSSLPADAAYQHLGGALSSTPAAFMAL